MIPQIHSTIQHRGHIHGEQHNIRIPLLSVPHVRKAKPHQEEDGQRRMTRRHPVALVAGRPRVFEEPLEDFGEEFLRVGHGYCCNAAEKGIRSVRALEEDPVEAEKGDEGVRDAGAEDKVDFPQVGESERARGTGVHHVQEKVARRWASCGLHFPYLDVIALIIVSATPLNPVTTDNVHR
eukprot:TRINITY_DN9323_c0_g4_i2.p1 TRINITY_DN9323_c0_g4~~TRINITY_DN9323_c0_g4_i2.p1  ORF type:complete len:180 (+),score=1.90 TRINITY_DN9323_c0_g4_i2:260-799(+)